MFWAVCVDFYLKTPNFYVGAVCLMHLLQCVYCYVTWPKTLNGYCLGSSVCLLNDHPDFMLWLLVHLYAFDLLISVAMSLHVCFGLSQNVIPSLQMVHCACLRLCIFLVCIGVYYYYQKFCNLS